MGAMAFEDNVFFKALGLPLFTRSTSTFLDWQRDVQRRAPKSSCRYANCNDV